MNKIKIYNLKIIYEKNSTIFLQVVLVLIGIGTLVLMLRLPLYEGRNVNATLFQVYFNDPFLAYAYASSIAFFLALFEAFKLLRYIGHNQVFTLKSVKALRTIKYCALSLVGLILAPVALLFIVRPEDDIAGGVAGGLFLIFVSTIIATAAAIFENFCKPLSILNPKTI